MNEKRTHDFSIEQAMYDARKAELIAQHRGQWVLIAEGSVQIHDSIEAAYMDAVQRFGRRPHFIREIAEDTTIEAPALVMGLLDAKL